jgi:hypothetical protein
MSDVTLIQCHFVRGRLNHRIRFGTPIKTIKLDKYRKLACFESGTTLGYIRWKANEFGTQDWRFFIFQTRNDGLLTRVPGVAPAVKLLASFHGTDPVKHALLAFDEVEKECAGELSSLSDSYWLGFQNHLNARKNLLGKPRNSAITDVSYAR